MQQLQSRLETLQRQADSVDHGLLETYGRQMAELKAILHERDQTIEFLQETVAREVLPCRSFIRACSDHCRKCAEREELVGALERARGDSLATLGSSTSRQSLCKDTNISKVRVLIVIAASARGSKTEMRPSAEVCSRQ